MRRGIVLSLLLAPMSVAFVTASPASAAKGGLTVAGVPYTDPQGCVVVQAEAFVFVVNRTDGTAVVYAAPHCTGGVVETLPPSARPHLLSAGQSLFIA